jgi:hypothetical protein
MGPLELGKVNEAIGRAKAAIEKARDAVLIAQRRKSFNANVNLMPLEERKYVDFFGTYDATRFARILTNFQVLSLAFGSTPEIMDVRNRKVWWNTFGGCVRENKVEIRDKVPTLTKSVTMMVGRGFFGATKQAVPAPSLSAAARKAAWDNVFKAQYEPTTDDTIATLVHEFAHGSFNAVDVPDLDATGTFQCTRQSHVPNNPNFGNSTDPFNHQCGTESADKLLAQRKPDYAVVNADSYGQFTKRLLIAAKK